MKIRTDFVFPPIPIRQFDWSAVDEDTFDGPGCKVGTGATEAEARADLIDQMLDDDEAICPHCGAERGRDRPDGCRDQECPTMGDAA